MGHDETRERGSMGIVVLIIVLILATLAGLAIVGLGAVFVARTSAVREMAQIERARAIEAQRLMVEAQLFREQASVKTLQAAAGQKNASKEATASAAVDGIIIHVDEAGTLLLGGEAVSLDQLPQQFKKLAHPQAGGSLRISILAHAGCRFEQVARVIAVCESLGYEQIRVGEWKATAEAPAAPGPLEPDAAPASGGNSDSSS